MANAKSDIALMKELLLKQREQYFDRNEDKPEIERRKNDGATRSISDRRSNLAPNKSDYSRRKTAKERRKTRFGRRKFDFPGRSKLLEG